MAGAVEVSGRTSSTKVSTPSTPPTAQPYMGMFRYMEDAASEAKEPGDAVISPTSGDDFGGDGRTLGGRGSGGGDI